MSDWIASKIGQSRRAQRRAATCALLIAIGAGSLAGCEQRVTPHAQRYSGRLSGCGDVPASLVSADRSFSFVPGDGVLVIRGDIGPDSAFDAVLNTQPAGKPAFVLRVSGRLGPTQAMVDYATPRCRAHAVLTAAE